MRSTIYIANEMKAAGMSTSTFMAEWKRLSDDEKKEMLMWAEDECRVLGVELEGAA